MQPHPADQFFSLLATLLLPGGKGALAVFVAFFDESERVDDGRHFTVAGFVLANQQATRLQKFWRRDVAEPFQALTGEPFHMKRMEFLRLKYGERVTRHENRAIDLINEHISKAVAVLFKRDEVERVWTRAWKERYGSLYAVLCQLGMAFTGEWADRAEYSGPIAYIFESGHKDQRNADKVIANIRLFPDTVRQYRYYTHAFLAKDVNMPLQAADVWAWNAARHFADQEAGLPMLPSMRRLLGSHPERYDLRHKTGEENVRRFFEETLAAPWKNKRGEAPHRKRMEHLKKRGEVPGG